MRDETGDQRIVELVEELSAAVEHARAEATRPERQGLLSSIGVMLEQPRRASQLLIEQPQQ